MAPEALSILAITCSTMCVNSIGPMFSIVNRPRVFRGRVGEFVFHTMNLLVIALTGSLIIWSLINVPWPVAILLIVGTASIAGYVCRALASLVLGNAVAAIIGVMGLVVLHKLAWF